MSEIIQEEMRHTYMTGGTGVIKTKNDIYYVHASTIRKVGNGYFVKTETNDEIRIPIKDIVSAYPAK